MAQTSKLTHKDVKEMAKHDVFREKTLETVDYVSGHRSQVLLYTGLAVAAILLGIGIWLYRDSQHTVRQNALNDAFKVYNSQLVEQGDPPPFVSYWFRTKAEQAAAINKSFTSLADKYGSSDEAEIAHYYLGIIASDGGNSGEAEKQFLQVSGNASKDYAALAKLSLAQLYKSQGKIDEGRKLLQSLMDHSTTFVTKEEATIEMARLLQQSKPDEARKLLEPLRTSERTGVSQAAISILGELINKK